MPMNLATNVQAALHLIPSKVHRWLDWTVALHWIKGQGEYGQFVSNRLQRIQQHSEVPCHYVPSKDNQADLGSQGKTL